MVLLGCSLIPGVVSGVQFGKMFAQWMSHRMSLLWVSPLTPSNFYTAPLWSRHFLSALTFKIVLFLSFVSHDCLVFSLRSWQKEVLKFDQLTGWMSWWDWRKTQRCGHADTGGPDSEVEWLKNGDNSQWRKDTRFDSGNSGQETLNWGGGSGLFGED